MNGFQASHQQQIDELRAQLAHANQTISLLRSSSHHPRPHPHQDLHAGECPVQSSAAPLPLPPAVDLSRNATIPNSSAGPRRHHGDQVASRQHLRGNGASRTVKLSRTMSQQIPASQQMDRVGSNLSTRSAGPFSGTAPISPPPRVPAPSVQRHPVPSPMGYTEVPNHPTQNPHQSRMSSLTDNIQLTSSSLVDPATWVAALPTTDESSMDFDGFPYCTSAFDGDMDMTNLNMGESVCGSMTSGPTYDTGPMTRQNSQFEMESHSAAGGVQMINVGSQMSSFADSSQLNPEYPGASPLGKPSYNEDGLLTAVGSSLAPPTSHQYASTTSPDGFLRSSDMERTASSTSSVSIKSTASSLSARAKDTLRLQNQRASNTLLKMKPADQSSVDVRSEVKRDGGKAPIPQSRKYVRPRQPKVFCKDCDEHKEGFRGDHELRRHRDAKHQHRVKKFICVDPKEQGLPVNVNVVNSLAKCKACKSQKKYGAYYNAAAHLRRTHFKEKPSRSKTKSSGPDDERRGGKGGGDWPSMPELKNWMKEVWVHKNDSSPKDDDDADEDMDNNISGSPDDGVDEGAESFPLHSTGINTAVEYNSSFPTMSPDMAMMVPPLSSADFNFIHPHSFTSDVAVYMGQMNTMSSAVSSAATVTPGTVFNNDATQPFTDNFDYHYTR